VAGGKGANLGELMRAGFPVPDGFVITTEAFRVAARAADVDAADAKSAPQRMRSVAVPRDVADAIRDGYRALGGGRVAVRSSATARRRRASIDAVSGLADKLVSGAANPEHYVVDTPSLAISDRGGTLLDDRRLRQLAQLGDQVEAHFGKPQDIEWAIDDSKLWL